jgi:hypothetical protein
MAARRLARVNAQFTSISTAANFMEGTNYFTTPPGKGLVSTVTPTGVFLLVQA